MDEIPIYIGVTEISQHLGYWPNNIRYHYARRKSGDPHSCPEADAYVRDKTGHLTPLWLAHRTEAWENWARQRKLLQPDPNGPRKRGRPAKPTPPKPEAHPKP
jgi:hypothetical protein